MADFMEQARQLLRGAQRGASSDVLGMPVDVINMLLKALDSTKILPQKFSTQEPFAGSEWWHKRLQNAGMAARATDTPTEQMGRVLGGFAVNPTTVGKTGMLLEDFAKNRAEYYSSIAPFVSRAVKEPGGMWHPEAASRLSEPLFTSLTGRRSLGDPQDYINTIRELQAEGNVKQESVERLPLAQWSDRAIRNYLNKYAGTSRDPLKDVEVPFEGGVKRWEDITDAVFEQRPVEHYDKVSEGLGKMFGQVEIRRRDPALVQAKPSELVAGIRAGRMYFPEGRALESYLSHVGDYLRQNVPPHRLQQYDLTRAFRETVANDARMAKQMEKAAQQSMAELPVYKEYPEGYRWVELRLPEKLTPEQAKGVRRATEQEVNELSGFDDLGQHDKGYVAIGADGRPIVNTYTGAVAVGKSPAEAYLAGRLAEEGNQMGHCVGGYCEDVASGASKIYSLRDAKGRSHVTVEVEPTTPKHRAADTAQDLSRESIPSILQIKGKQNRAPNPEYLPYVQDFVRSGKWGDVRDLENTGLIRLPDGTYGVSP